MEELLHAILPYLSDSGQQRTLSAAHEALSQVPHNPPLEVPSTSTFNDLGGLEVDSRVVVPPKTHLRDLALSANVCQLSSSSETCSEREFLDFCQTLGEIPNSLRMEEQTHERQGPTLPPVPRTVPAANANAFSFSEAGPSNRNLLSSPYSPAPVQVEGETGEETSTSDYTHITPQIGGESFSQIYLRLICNYKGKGELPKSKFFFDKASPIFEMKGRILFKLEELEPNRGWLESGARFIQTKNGQDFSLNSLRDVFFSLERQGQNSPYFVSFVSKRDKLLSGWW